MILPYFLRLVCLCLASFFLVQLAMGTAVWLATPAIIRLTERVSPRAATRILFYLRLSPILLAGLLVLGLGVPSYVWLEPRATEEMASLTFCLIAFLGAAAWCFSISRVLHAAVRSSRYARQCREIGREFRWDRAVSPISVLDVETPMIALAGVFRPRVLVSRSVLNLLSREQLDAAMRHENAHRISRDNLKRFLFLMAPGIFPLAPGLATLERAWARFSEWAADDDATRGDERMSLFLAAALVRVARMGTAPQLLPTVTPLIAGERDLTTRVDRLLRAKTELPPPLSKAAFLVCGLTIVTIGVTVAMQWPVLLRAAHLILEQLVS